MPDIRFGQKPEITVINDNFVLPVETNDATPLLKKVKWATIKNLLKEIFVEQVPTFGKSWAVTGATQTGNGGVSVIEFQFNYNTVLGNGVALTGDLSGFIAPKDGYYQFDILATFTAVSAAPFSVNITAASLGAIEPDQITAHAVLTDTNPVSLSLSGMFKLRAGEAVDFFHNGTDTKQYGVFGAATVLRVSSFSI